MDSTVQFFSFTSTAHACFDYFVVVVVVALRPKSTAMVMAGRSVHLTTLVSWASLKSDPAEGKRMTVIIIS